MTKNIYFIAISFMLFSCSVEKLVKENNETTKKISIQNDSIIQRIQNVINNENKIHFTESAPQLLNLKKTTFENFYFGDIINEQISEKKGEWVKIKVLEKVETKKNQFFLKERSGWYSYKTPEVIYQLNDSNIQTTNINENESPVVIGNLNFNDYSNSKAFTTKIDLFDQKMIDELLSHKAMNFDGLKFDSKRFDYSNFALGSFRGTYFLNSNLSNLIAVRESITNDFDFFETKIEGGINKDWIFGFWKFKDFVIINTTLENCKFSNCLFTSDLQGVHSFFNTTIKKSTFDNSLDGYFKIGSMYKTTFESCKFINSKVYGTVCFELKFIDCNFQDGFWQGIGFNNTQVPASKITGGNFKNFKFIAGDLTYIVIEPYGGVKTNFSNVEFVGTFLNNAKIDASFNVFKMQGLGNFSNINFLNSNFENGTFGNTITTPLLNLKNCNFSNCEFRGNVKFINCDLTGSVFPSNISNIEFVNCPGRPTN